MYYVHILYADYRHVIIRGSYLRRTKSNEYYNVLYFYEIHRDGKPVFCTLLY